MFLEVTGLDCVVTLINFSILEWQLAACYHWENLSVLFPRTSVAKPRREDGVWNRHSISHFVNSAHPRWRCQQVWFTSLSAWLAAAHLLFLSPCVLSSVSEFYTPLFVRTCQTCISAFWFFLCLFKHSNQHSKGLLLDQENWSHQFVLNKANHNQKWGVSK